MAARRDLAGERRCVSRWSIEIATPPSLWFAVIVIVVVVVVVGGEFVVVAAVVGSALVVGGALGLAGKPTFIARRA